ncbi:MAG: DMT family transporter [Thermotogota bacterium]
MQNKTKGLIFLSITVVLWGISFVATSVVVRYIPPIIAGFIRFSIASIFLMIFVRKNVKYTKKEVFYLIMTGFFGITAYFIFENTALMYTTPSNSSLIISSTPIFFLIVNDIIQKKLSNKIRYLGTLIAFTGVTLLILNGKYILELNPIGDLLMMIPVFSWIVYTIYLEKLNVKHSNLIITRDMTMYGAIFFAPFAILEMLKADSCPVYELWLQPMVIISLLFLGILCSAIGYIFWNYSVKLAGSKTTINGIYFIPMVTLIADSIFLKNIPNVFTLIGAILIISGTYIAEKKF